MPDGRYVHTTVRAKGFVLTTMTTTLSLSVCGVDDDDNGEWNWVWAISIWLQGNLRLNNVKRVKSF